MRTETFDRTTTVRVIYRCRSCERAAQQRGEKRPRVALRVVYRVREHGARYYPTEPYLRTRVSLRRDWSHEDGTPIPPTYCSNEPGWLPTASCPRCEKQLYGKPVKGFLKPDVPCNVKCTSAIGDSCECSCGGANHGADHGGRIQSSGLLFGGAAR